MITIETDGMSGKANVIISGYDQEVLDHKKADIEMSLKLLKSFAQNSMIVPGAAVTYLKISKKIKERAVDRWGPERLPMLAYADALSRIGMSLMRNMGEDPLKGLDGKNLEDLRVGGKAGAVEPVSVPMTVLKSSSEIVKAILRIDDVISAKQLHQAETFGGGGGKVVVYTTPTCPWCSKVKSYLKSKGVSFVEKDVSSDMSAAQEMHSLTGQMGTPVTKIKGEAVVGFDEERLASLI
ncbi:MAG: TCP-1/cpn60 chaperonin family protein [Candidatus Thermoplasmatota archaeon]|nr:TCP-1/cpn60 chaperonin family protein [Candidatus Thermoplasmatota archaeon]